MRPPRLASILCDWSVTSLNRTSKVCKNQMATDAAKIMVNALVMKPFALSHASCRVVFALGMR